jgi:hypothetical protein
MRRDALAIVAAAASMALAFAPPAPAQPAPATSAEFTVPTSDGYRLEVTVDRGVLELTASRAFPPLATATGAGRVVPADGIDGVSTTYSVPVSGTVDHPEADLGSFGHIAVTFEPSGARRIAHLNQQGKTNGCVFPRRIVRRLGTFTGTIEFRGENGYASVEATSAPGSLGTSPFRNCSTKRPAASPETVTGQAGPDAFLNASDRDGVSFFASTLGPGVSFHALSAEALPGGLAVFRTAQATATGASLSLDAERHVVTLRPPPPFSGHATFRQGSGASPSWSGSLAIAFPGVTTPLTGPSFHTQLRLAK